MTHTASRGPGRPPAAKSAQTRGRILRTAREVFSELGYDAATFQEIALRADLTRPAINHYFPSKRALYRQVDEQTNATLIDAGIAQARLRDTFAGRIEAFITAALSGHDLDRSAAAFLMTSVQESQRHPDLSHDEHDTLNATRGFVSWALREAEAAGELMPAVDVDAVTEALLAMLLGVGFYAGFVGRQARLVAVTDEFVRLLGGQAFVRSA
ncbi:MAG: helix-turn-helix domain containing protein [Mycobacterium sp.]|nr:helix-turn-helix domain containing protein [Mycobacterium sp.]